MSDQNSWLYRWFHGELLRPIFPFTVSSCLYVPPVTRPGTYSMLIKPPVTTHPNTKWVVQKIIVLNLMMNLFVMSVVLIVVYTIDPTLWSVKYSTPERKFSLSDTWFVVFVAGFLSRTSVFPLLDSGRERPHRHTSKVSNLLKSVDLPYNNRFCYIRECNTKSMTYFQ